MNRDLLISEFSEGLKMAIAAIRSNKLRSVLTLLGIVVGVFSIIAVVTAMRVLQNSVETELTSLGSNVFVIQKFPAIQVGGPAAWAKYRNRKDIKYEQALALKERMTLAKSVGASIDKFGMVVTYQGNKTNPNVTLYGVTPDIFAAQNWNVAEGRAIGQGDLETDRLVCVLGSFVAKVLFPHSDPLDQEVSVNGITYKVIGVLEDQGNVLGGQSGNFVVIPITTFFTRYGKQRSVDIYVQSLTQEVMPRAEEQAEGILRAIRNVPPGSDNDFEIISNESLVGQFNQITFYVRIGAIVVSAIALLAAGVGIMNIMLVSVTERTREIGIRKSVGATKRNILLQFMLEAVVLSEVGGIVGVLLGLIGGNLAALSLHMKAAFPLDWAIIGLVVCSIVGITFGVYPAYKAASVDPIESLRYE